jgi:hypothetical protein
MRQIKTSAGFMIIHKVKMQLMERYRITNYTYNYFKSI